MKSKYKLNDMELGEKKRFSAVIYSQIRLACHFTGKKHGKKFSTKKTEKTVTVTRVL